MHLLLIHQAFVPPSQSGGTRHYEFARYMVDRGDDFTIVASALNYLTGEGGNAGNKLVTEQTEDGIRILRAYAYPALHKSFIWRIISFLSFMFSSFIAALRVKDVDVVMGTTPPIFQAVSAWMVAFLRRKPFLLEVRDLWPEFAIDMGVLTNPIIIALSRWLENFLYNRATHLVVNSPAYRDYLINKGIPANKITFVPNGVDPAMFDPNTDGDAVRQEFGLNGQFVVTYAGALGMANDIGTILRAADDLQGREDIHFLLVGDGKERSNLEKLASELNLKNVTFTGARPKSEMAQFLAATDACTATLQNIPMFATTYPNKVFDYMAAERPTILAIDGVIRQVVEAADGGVFVEPSNPKALANAVIDMVENREATAAMGKSARKYVVSHFNRQDQAEVFHQLFLSLGEKK